MRRTNASEIASIFAIATIVCYLLVRAYYDQLPPLHYYTAVPLAALAIVELVLARRVRAAVSHDPEARLMTAISIARLVALGRATALAAAAICGAFLALVLRVAPDAGDVRAAGSDLRTGSVALGASIVLLVAGLLLEAAGIDPNRGNRPPGSGPPVGNR
jgi:hypothetical protein